MKKTGIMTDSHSGILENEASKLGIAVLPMPFYIDEKLYREGVDISREEFYEMLRKGADVATSQPSPESVICGQPCCRNMKNLSIFRSAAV